MIPNLSRVGAALRLAVVLVALSFSMAFPKYEGLGFALIVPTAVINKPGMKSWTITALDADTSLVFAHGMKQTSPSGNPSTGQAPGIFGIQPLVSYANAALPNWGMTVDGTNITLSKTAATASGGATPGTTVIAQVWVWRPDSASQS
jgi:hypothetical protein